MNNALNILMCKSKIKKRLQENSFRLNKIKTKLKYKLNKLQEIEELSTYDSQQTRFIAI